MCKLLGCAVAVLNRSRGCHTRSMHKVNGRGVSNHSLFVHIDEVPGISTRAQICELFKSFFVNKLLIIEGVHTGVHPFCT